MIYGILEYFFPREDFVPEEDFVLSIFSPLLLTFTCGNDCTCEDFVLGEFCPGKIFFALNLCNLMVTLMIYGILEYFFFPGRILSSAYSLHYYLHSLVAMIVFGRILSWEDFVLCLCNSMVSLMIYGFLEYFFSPGRILSLGDFILGKILSPTHALLCCATIVFRRIMKLERFCLGMILSSPYALYYGQHSD